MLYFNLIGFSFLIFFYLVYLTSLLSNFSSFFYKKKRFLKVIWLKGAIDHLIYILSHKLWKFANSFHYKLCPKAVYKKNHSLKEIILQQLVLDVILNLQSWGWVILAQCWRTHCDFKLKNSNKCHVPFVFVGFFLLWYTWPNFVSWVGFSIK